MSARLDSEVDLMKKLFVSFLLISMISLFLFPLTAQAAVSLANFTAVRTYAYQFSDVTDQWYAADVRQAYEYALVDGTSPSTFSPDKNLTLAEAVKLAACLSSIYSTGTNTLANGTVLWYQPYVDYALAHRILQAPYQDYGAVATRADMAVIFAGALPDEALPPINTIADDTIPDVTVSASYGAAVYKLYRAGVLTGVNEAHAYKPQRDDISRGEAVSILARMADSSGRKPFSIFQSGSAPGNSQGSQVSNFTLDASSQTISVEAGAAVNVDFTVSALGFAGIIPVISSPSVAACSWAIPKERIFPLLITGLTAGSTDITVQLTDYSGKVLAKKTVAVTVTGSGTLPAASYFPGYYPAPDYSAYVGTAPSFVSYDALNGSISCAYRVSDLTVDLNYAVSGYIDLLEQNGFVYDYTFTSADGNDINVYRHPVYNLRVFFTNSKMVNVPSIIIRITPT